MRAVSSMNANGSNGLRHDMVEKRIPRAQEEGSCYVWRFFTLIGRGQKSPSISSVLSIAYGLDGNTHVCTFDRQPVGFASHLYFMCIIFLSTFSSTITTNIIGLFKPSISSFLLFAKTFPPLTLAGAQLCCYPTTADGRHINGVRYG